MITGIRNILEMGVFNFTESKRKSFDRKMIGKSLGNKRIMVGFEITEKSMGSLSFKKGKTRLKTKPKKKSKYTTVFNRMKNITKSNNNC